MRRLVAGGQVAYWVEIEPRPYVHDRYRSLVFSTTGAMAIKAVVRRLLEVAAERAGVWPSSATLKRLVTAGGRSGIEACAGWQHVRLKPGENVPKQLWADAVIAEIRKVL